MAQEDHDFASAAGFEDMVNEQQPAQDHSKRAKLDAEPSHGVSLKTEPLPMTDPLQPPQGDPWSQLKTATTEPGTPKAGIQINAKRDTFKLRGVTCIIFFEAVSGAYTWPIPEGCRWVTIFKGDQSLRSP